MADSLGAWGRLALLQGDLQKAEALLCEGVTLAHSFNYQVNLANYQPLLALVMLYSGDTAEARRLLAESLRLCLDLNDRYFLAPTIRHLPPVRRFCEPTLLTRRRLSLVLSPRL
jgi:ATP/maltotriose-dependent transcriptional regulator MalT